MLTTSQRIAVRMSITIASIVLFLGIVINVLFFASRWQREQQQIRKFAAGTNEQTKLMLLERKFAKKRGEPFGPRMMMRIQYASEEHEELEEHTLFANLAEFDEEWYVYQRESRGQYVIVADISPIVHNQIALLRITLITLIIFSGLGYLVAVKTVQKGLHDLHTLSDYVQQLDVDSLHKQQLAFFHLPPHDEIHILSRAIDEMTTKLHTQVTTIKQFVANVSHEFKTPLMSLQSTVDVGEKTKDYVTIVTQTRAHIGVMNRLLETLTMLTYAQKDISVEKTMLRINEVVLPLVNMMQEKYPGVHFIYSNDGNYQITTHQGFLERIVSNLLDNAGKFTAAGGTVTVTIKADGLEITDTGVGIAVDQLDHIWDAFWQSDYARGTEGFGLGLALVKQFVTLLGRNISVKSSIGVGTTFIIQR